VTGFRYALVLEDGEPADPAVFATIVPALMQAAFDELRAPLVGPGGTAAHVRITSIRVSTRLPRFPAGVKYIYRSFAAVDIFSSSASGPAVLLFGYYVSPGISGWRLLSGPGSDAVGCDVSNATFHGFKAAVLTDLRLSC
jgi:hypothetical protein